MDLNEKQIAILETAERLFAINGFNGASVRDIAQEAGVNVAMISYYFGSKEKLMEALFELKTEKMRLKVETLIADDTKSNLDKVYNLIDEYVEKFMNQPKFHKIMIQEQLVDSKSGVPEMIKNLKKRNLETIKKLINAGQKTGEFKKQVDVALMVSTMVGTVSQMIISEDFYKEANKLEHLNAEEYTKYTKKKIANHLKYIFKATLTNESN